MDVSSDILARGRLRPSGSRSIPALREWSAKIEWRPAKWCTAGPVMGVASTCRAVIGDLLSAGSVHPADGKAGDLIGNHQPEQVTDQRDGRRARHGGRKLPYPPARRRAVYVCRRRRPGTQGPRRRAEWSMSTRWSRPGSTATGTARSSVQVSSAEDGAGWLAFFRDLTARGRKPPPRRRRPRRTTRRMGRRPPLPRPRRPHLRPRHPHPRHPDHHNPAGGNHPQRHPGPQRLTAQGSRVKPRYTTPRGLTRPAPMAGPPPACYSPEAARRPTW